MNIRAFSMAAIMSVCAATLCAESSTNPPATGQATDNVPMGQKVDAMVLSKMHQKNLAEMKVGQLAMEKGQSEQVRRYGKRLHADHQFADQKVQALAQKKGITLAEPKPMTEEDRQNAEAEKSMMEKLQQAQGEQFDQAFAEAMDKGHGKVIATLQGSLAKLQDSDVRELVQKMIPILEQHQTLAQDIEGKLKPTGGAQANR